MMHLFIPLSQKLQSSQADLFTEFKKKTVLEVKFTNSTNFPLAKNPIGSKGLVFIFT